MNNSKQTKTSIIHTRAGNLYEVENSIDYIKQFMFDDFIHNNTFLQFRFPDGFDLYLRKKDIESFYEND